ncbi:glycosyltransferase family 4 protein [Bacteroidetes bacterium endosymbiont of Geopemphigus sp.]|nr:glycosyltransferase family 4 protein [Bacteroidetes bacterium endosymbiont of Geopemphigus sp.]
MKKVQKYGIKTLFIPGNPNDQMIYEIVASEKKKLSLNYIDPYDYISRLNTYKKTIQYFDHIIAINTIYYDTYVSRGYKNVHLLPFIPSNINVVIEKQIPTNVQYRSEHIRIGFLAHIVLLKGLHYLLDALSKLSQREYILIIGGKIENSPYKEEIEKRIALLGKHIKMLGHIQSKEDFFNQIDITVVPSIIEGIPMVLYESLERGVPVLATDKCGGKDVIDEGKNGFIVSPGDAQEIYKKLIYYKNNKSSFNREHIITDFKNKTKYSHEKFIRDFHSYIKNVHT